MDDLDRQINEELDRISRDIRKRANRLTAFGLIVWSVIVGTIWAVTGDFDRVSKLSTSAFYFVILGWGAWFVYAYFLRMERKQDLALRLVLRSNTTFQEMRREVEPIIKDLRDAMGDVKDVASHVRKAVDRYAEAGDVAQGALTDMKKTLQEAFSENGNGVFGRIATGLKELKDVMTPDVPLPKGVGTFGIEKKGRL